MNIQGRGKTHQSPIRKGFERARTRVPQVSRFFETWDLAYLRQLPPRKTK